MRINPFTLAFFGRAILLGSVLASSVFAQGADECTNAQPIVTFGPHVFDQSLATNGLNSYICRQGATDDVWFEWVAPTTGLFEVVATFDPAPGPLVVAVIDHCDGVAVGCGVGHAEFLTAAGNSYLIRMGIDAGLSVQQGTSGSFVINPILAEWPILPELRPGSLHGYQAIDSRTTWLEAQAVAESLVYMGVPGHLATAEDATENDYLLSLLSPSFPIGWFGLYQDRLDPSYSEPDGGWKWITGEPLVYTNWLPGKPNGFFGNVDYGALIGPGWEDEENRSTGFGLLPFVIEWDLEFTSQDFCSPANPNSIGSSTALEALGSTEAPSGAHLEITFAPPGEFGYFLVGTGFSDPGIVFGAGEFCLAVGAFYQVGRYNFSGTVRDSIGQIGADGLLHNLAGTSATGTGFDIPQEMPLPNDPLIAPGSTWHFQFWHREPGGSSNFSNGVSLTF